MRSHLFAALLAAAALVSEDAFAHKVVAAVFVEGEAIEGEVGFSNGNPAKPGLKVQVHDPDGRLLGETVTDEDGLFRFVPTSRVEHRFVIDLGMGHVAQAILSADQLPDGMGGTTEATAATVSTAPSPKTAGVAASAAVTAAPDLRVQIDKAVASQIRPLRKDLAAFKEEVRWRDVLGGIGYILGLTGIGLWVAARRRETTDG